VGYLPLVDDPHGSRSRRRGALETGLGADAVVASANRAGLRLTSPEQLFEAAREGDRAALQVVRTIADRIALAVAAVAPVLDPELVIVGGSIGSQGDVLLDRVREELRTLSPFTPRVEVSPLGVEAELIGALSLALEAAEEQLFARAEAKGGIAV
jgi:predicted NBD/HSP70 family sugar kinase